MTRVAFEYIRTLLADTAAIRLDNKAYLVETRLLPVARQAGLSCIDDLVTRLRTAPDDGLRQQVVDAMTTNETSFFRDQIPFEILRTVILPDLFARRAESKKLHIWSAGCASGQEPYSIAILLREHFSRYHDWDIRLLGTDLSMEMVARARGGRFTQFEVERGLSPTLLQKYFRRLGTAWQLDEAIRRRVEFRQFNLHGDWPSMPKIDIILLRNVLVYFGLATSRDILRRVRQVLRPDGYLLLGGAETVTQIDEHFQTIRGEGFSYYRLKTA